MSWVRRDWDSRFFGYPVASASFQAGPDLEDEVRRVLQAVRRSDVRLLYLQISPVEASLRQALERMGARHVGQRVEFARQARVPVSSVQTGEISPGREATPALVALALESGLHSRFHLDPGFTNREYERLYEEWLASSLRGDDGKCVRIAGSAAAPEGLITLEPAPQEVRIGLLAVDAQRRGQGWGQRLLEEADHFCRQHRLATIRVATQAENQKACQFYARCGFTEVAAIDYFHFWQPEPPGNGIG